MSRSIQAHLPIPQPASEWLYQEFMVALTGLGGKAIEKVSVLTYG